MRGGERNEGKERGRDIMEEVEGGTRSIWTKVEGL